jgi:hypothetical protein
MQWEASANSHANGALVRTSSTTIRTVPPFQQT